MESCSNATAFIFAAALLLAGAPVLANPFLSGGDDTTPGPPLRTPSSSGPATALQAELRETAASSIRTFAEDPTTGALLLLLGAAFVYGILHAAGPGHRKTVVFSLFLSRRAKAWEPLAAGFLSAGVHATTFGLMALLSLILITLKVLRMRAGTGERGQRSAGRGLYGIVAITSLVPCPGATMLLLFAMYADLLWVGALGVAAMSVGMGLVISAAGYLAFVGREGVFSRLKAKERIIGIVSDILEVISYLLVLGFALYTMWPLIRG